MAKLNTLKTKEEVLNLCTIIENSYDFVSYDTETNGVSTDAKIIGISICGNLEESHYIVLRYWDMESKDLLDLETLEVIAEIYKKLLQKKLIMHNSVFDCWHTFYNFGVELMPSVHTDTMILGHLLDENRRNGLKELSATLFGENVKDEQIAMRESVYKNGGVLKADNYELYKADMDLIAKYGAQDALLTLKLFYSFVPQLYEEKLERFFYEEESMPLLKGPTYELNTSGLSVDPDKLLMLKKTIEVECMESKAIILSEINEFVKDKYPGTSKKNHFNIDSNLQLSWLLFDVLGNYIDKLTPGGKEFCKDNDIKIPYSNKAKRDFIEFCKTNKGQIFSVGRYNKKTKKMGGALKIRDFWSYTSSDKNVLAKFADKYRWVAELLKYNKNMTILNTYVMSIEEKMRYNVIHPRFIQHGTTSGRYASKDPNFQNLPRDDKRVKNCIVSEPGKVFIGADYAQLEPRVFASISRDEKLINSFANGEDFYSVVGAPIFDKEGYSLIKSDPRSFAALFPKLRDKAKVIALATPYGRTASFTAEQMGVTREEAQEIMDKYFGVYPKVELMMLESHEQAKRQGIVYSLFGRPRRMPEAKNLEQSYGNTEHKELPYAARNILNLSMNHRVQSTAASIINRASIAFYNKIRDLGIKNCRIVMQVHDELIIECSEADSSVIANILKQCMENTTTLPGVKLQVEPKIGKTLADIK